MHKSKKRRIKDKDSFIKKTLNALSIVLFELFKPRNEKRKKQLEYNLKFLPKKLSVYRLYKFKFLFAFVFFVISIAIYSTNLYYYKQDVIPSSTTVNTIDLTNFDELNYLQSKGSREFGRREFDYYNYIIENYPKIKSIKNISNSDQEPIVKELEDILIEGFPEEEAHNATAKRMLSKIRRIQNYSYSFLYFIWVFVGYFLPNIFIWGYLKYKKAIYARDIPNIKLATYLLGTMDTTIKELLISLTKVSSAYEKVFTECINNFNSTSLTREEAIMLMTKRVDNIQFRKLCAILKEGIKTSKNNAISILEQDIIMEDKEEMMLSEDKIEKKTWIAIILIAICMLCMAMLFLMPFANMFTNINFM